MAIEVTDEALRMAVDAGIAAARKAAYDKIEAYVNNQLKETINAMHAGTMIPPAKLYIHVHDSVSSQSPYHFEQMEKVAKALVDAGIHAVATVDDDDRWETKRFIEVQLQQIK